MVDVAGVSKAEGNSAEDQSEGQDDCRYCPSCTKRSPHKAVPQGNLPADLHVERYRSQECPHHGATASKKEERARDCACPIRVHIIWCDGVEALLRPSPERYDETQLYDLSSYSPTEQDQCSSLPALYRWRWLNRHSDSAGGSSALVGLQTK